MGGQKGGDPRDAWLRRDYAVEPFEKGIRRLCAHSQLEYRGLYAVRNEKGMASFRTAEAVEGAKVFARRLLG